MNIDLSPLLIRASAGTGKTFRLSNRFLGLLLCGEQADKILATTFTRKAAGEIQERVFQRLALAASSDQEAGELGTFLGIPGLRAEQSLNALLRLISLQHRLQICTLDSFCIQIARCFSFELGLLPGWGMLDEARAARLRQLAIAASCKQPDSEEFLELLRMMNRGDVTRSVQKRLEFQITSLYQIYLESNQEAWQWFVFPPELSVSEQRRILSELDSFEIPRTAKGTVNKNWERAHAGLLSSFQDENWEAFLANGLSKKILEGREAEEALKYSRVEIDTALVDLLDPLIQHAASQELSELARQTSASYKLVDMFHREFATLKFVEGVLQFDDVKRLLANNALQGRLSDVYYRLDGKVKHVLLDEFQDTSRYEWTVIEPIVEEILAQADEEHSFFCVGDVKQAIYGWRGGVAAIFDSLEARWEQLDKQSMETSYRSAGEIVGFVNQIFLSLERNEALAGLQDAATSWKAGFQEHSSAKEMDPAVRFPGAVTVEYYLDEDEQEGAEQPDKMQQLAQSVNALLEKGHEIEIGILVRANAKISRIIYELSCLGVSASGEGGSSLLDSAAVTPIFELLHLIDHPGDTKAAFHVSTSPLADQFGGLNWRSQRDIDRVVAEVQGLLLTKGLPETVDSLCKQMESLCSARDKRRLEQFVELAYEFSHASPVNVEAFLEFASLCKVEDTVRSAVRVMTVHQSKGLEFDAVFLPELDGALDRTSLSRALTYRESPMDPPSRVSIYPRAALRALNVELEEMYEQTRFGRIQEELSVLYVALTRAKQAVYAFIDRPGDPARFKASAAGVIRAALGSDFNSGADRIGFRLGDESWYKSLPKGASREPRKERKEKSVLEFSEGLKRRRGLPRKAPSAQEGGNIFQPGMLFSEGRKHASRAANRGTMIHLLFEQITWIEDFEMNEDELKRMLHLNGCTEEEAGGYVSELREMLQRKTVFEPLSKESYQIEANESLTVEQEMPFAVRDGKSMLTGVIDRLVLRWEGEQLKSAHILDFKSDSKPDSVDQHQWQQEKEEFYLPQLQSYRHAVESLYKLSNDQISASLLFVSEGIVSNLSL